MATYRYGDESAEVEVACSINNETGQAAIVIRLDGEALAGLDLSQAEARGIASGLLSLSTLPTHLRDLAQPNPRLNS